MNTYEQTLEEKIEDLETHVEALEIEIEDLSCKNDSYEALCVEMFEQMVILKASNHKIASDNENNLNVKMFLKFEMFLDTCINKLNEHIPEEEDDE